MTRFWLGYTVCGNYKTKLRYIFPTDQINKRSQVSKDKFNKKPLQYYKIYAKVIKFNTSRALYYWKISPQEIQKQPFGSTLRKRCSENNQQIYRRTLVPKCDFHKVALQFYWNHRQGCSPVNLLHIFRTPFYKNASGGLLYCKKECVPKHDSVFSLKFFP